MKQNQFANFIKNTAYGVATVCSIIIAVMAILTALAANAKEYTNPALEREKARVQWIAEHGQYQSNLTEPAKQEALAYTEQKQAEINRTWSK